MMLLSTFLTRCDIYPVFVLRVSFILKHLDVCFYESLSLFKQETPTKELGEHALDPSSQVSDFSSPVASSSYLNRFTNSESSTDEEGETFSTFIMQSGAVK